MKLPSTKHRIVVTGLGCVSPLGNSARETWDAAAAGRSGIGRITRFDPTPFRSHMAGEVKGFDPAGILTETEIATLDRFAQYALVAAIEAVGDAGVEVTEALTPRAGVALGVGLGGLASIER